MNSLKLCPFCGSVAKMNTPGYEYYSPCWVKCTQCGSEWPVRASKLEAQEAWNRRDQEHVLTRWISVKNRLPEKEGQYFCWFGKNTVAKGVAIATYLEMWKAFGSLESLETYPNVTHLMSIPEPPEKEK